MHWLLIAHISTYLSHKIIYALPYVNLTARYNLTYHCSFRLLIVDNSSHDLNSYNGNVCVHFYDHYGFIIGHGQLYLAIGFTIMMFFLLLFN